MSIDMILICLRLSSVIISRFLLNLRQLSDKPEDSLHGTSHSLSDRSHRSSLRFRSFVDNMGEQLDHDDSDGDMVWQHESGSGTQGDDSHSDREWDDEPEAPVVHNSELGPANVGGVAY